MYLCEARGQLLYQACSDIFPYDHITSLELLLWGRFYKEREQSPKKR